MRKIAIIIALPLLLGGLSSCYEYGGYGVASTGYYGDGYYPYDGWYDGYYGPIYDGYWGSDNYFYYRPNSRDRDYRRGDRTHFRNDRTNPGHGWNSMQGRTRWDRSKSMPNYPRHERREDSRHERRR